MKVAALTCVELFSRDILKFFPDNYSEDSIMKTIYDMAPTFSSTLNFCNVFNEWSNCSEIFYPTITEEGICYTFNIFNKREISSDEQVSKRIPSSQMKHFCKLFFFHLGFLPIFLTICPPSNRCQIGNWTTVTITQ